MTTTAYLDSPSIGRNEDWTVSVVLQDVGDTEHPCVCPSAGAVASSSTGILKPVILWPLRFASTASYGLRVTTNGMAETLLLSATAGRNYWMVADGTPDADAGVGGVGDLLYMLQTTLNTNTGGGAYTVAFDANFYITITCSAAFSVAWGSVLTTVNPAWWGFSAVTKPGGAGATITSDAFPYGLWRPNKPPATDTRDRQPVVGDITTALSGLQRTSDFVAAPKAIRDLTWLRVAQGKALIEYQLSSEPTGSWEYAWRNAVKLGRQVRYYADETNRSFATFLTAGNGLYRIRDKSTDGLDRCADQVLAWNVSLLLRRAD